MAIQNSKLSLGHNPERSDTMSTDPQNIAIMPHLMQKAHSKSDRVENLIETERKTTVKRMSHGVSKYLCRRLYEIKKFPSRL